MTSSLSPASSALYQAIPNIPDLSNADLSAQLRWALDHKTKPLGSLGRLENMAHQIGAILGTLHPELQQPQALIFAADHGLTRQGVSAYPSEVTWQMIANMLAGGAAINVLARQHGLTLKLIDCGVAKTLAPHPDLIDVKIAAGTADASEEAAMTLPQMWQAIGAGRQVVSQLPGNTILLGEMGIGNTSAAALILARLSGRAIDECAGAGTGLAAQALAHKRQVLQQVLTLHAHATQPLDVLACMGGLEIATMVGAILQAALERRIIVVDGFVTSAAVLIATRLQPYVLQRCIFSHQSHEQAHGLMLESMHAKALLQMDMRLGEGSGAALAWPLLESACCILREMASFESAQVSVRTPSNP